MRLQQTARSTSRPFSGTLLTIVMSFALAAFCALPTHAQDAEQPKSPAKMPIAVPAATAIDAVKEKAAANGQGNELRQILQGLDAKLGAALLGTRKFDVRAHADLAKIIKEQQAQDSGNYDLADPTRAKAFKLAGIPYAAYVQVNDFQDVVQQANFEGIGAKMTRRQIRLSLTCSVIDTTTGQLKEAINATLEDMKANNNPSYVVEQKGGDLSESIINTIADQLAAKVAQRVTDVLFPAKIVSVTAGVVAINRGDGTGIASGQIWEVFAVGESIVDPDTDDVLGVEEVSVGFVRITSVEPKLARAQVVDGEDRGIAKGCIVRRAEIPTQVAPPGDGVKHDSSSTTTPLPQAAHMIANALPDPPLAQPSAPATGDEPRARIAAIFVKNRDPQIADRHVMALEDFVVAGLDDTCFTTLSREDCLNSVAKFAQDEARQGANAGTTIDPQKDLDRILSDNASALRIAQMLGADYVLVASITALSLDQRTMNDPARGVDTKVTSYTLDATYRILGRAEGRVVATGSAMATDSTRQGGGLLVERDHITPLLRESAAKLCAAMKKRCATKGLPNPDALAQTTVEIIGTTADLAVPDIVKDDKGNLVVSSGTYQLAPTSFLVELDGVLAGTTPSPITAQPGLHKIRITRPGFEPYQGTVNIQPGVGPLVIPMKATVECIARWKDMAGFFQGLKEGQQLTDAQVKVLEGYAELLKNSKVSIDRKSDIKVDTNEAPVFNERSMWNDVLIRE